MHYYKRNLGDYAKKAGRLSMLQHGSYTLLIDACYDREQFPTLEDAIEWTWASSSAEIEAVEFVLRKFFTLESGVYVQKRIQEEIAEYRMKAETNKRIATERETNRKEKNTNREPVVNEAPPNHKPITINQEPVESKALADKPPKQSRRHRLPADFAPTESHQASATQKGLALPAEFEQFKFHHRAKGSTMLDWSDALHTWLGNAVKFKLRSGAPPASTGKQAARDSYSAQAAEARERMQRNEPVIDITSECQRVA